MDDDYMTVTISLIDGSTDIFKTPVNATEVTYSEHYVVVSDPTNLKNCIIIPKESLSYVKVGYPQPEMVE